MAVKIGSARIDENGKAHGGAAGDQTGKEVSTQNWYSRNWRVFRAKDEAKAKLIAKAMQAACDNKNIGYDQYQRNTLYNQVKPYGYDPAKATKKCETDCSALVRVCCAYAGIIMSDFNTSSEPSRLMDSGEFVELTGSKYTDRSDYLGVGDILCTKTKGHTVVVLTNGPKYEGSISQDLGDRIIRKGDVGDDVEEMQKLLNSLGYDCGEADGEYGSNTERGVKEFQRDNGLEVDGEFGPKSYEKLKELLSVKEEDEPEEEKPVQPVPEGAFSVIITGGSVNVRTGPSTINAVAYIAHADDVLTAVGVDRISGWFKLADGNYVSNKYAERMDGFDVIVTGGSVNVRTGPNTGYPVAYIAHKGDVLKAIAEDAESAWFALEDGNYISPKYSERK